MTSTEVAVRAEAMPAKLQYAKALAESGLLPAAYRKQPANVLYAIEYGEMLGLPPMAAINGIHVIEGKPSASAAIISALVRRAGHRLRVTGNDEKAVAEITRSDDPDYTFRSEWTLERAKRAELLGKGNWKKYPAAMLKARAITEVARDACEEALSGMHYTPEELGVTVDEDGIPLQVTSERAGEPAPQSQQREEIDWDEEIIKRAGDVKALQDLYKMAGGIYGSSNPELAEKIAQAGQVAAEAAKASESVETPEEPIDAELVEEPSTDDVPAGEGEPVQQIAAATRPMLTKLTLQLGELQVKDGELHGILSKLVGRPVASRKELNRDEATKVIELLERCLAGSDPLRKFDAVLASIDEDGAQ